MNRYIGLTFGCIIAGVLIAAGAGLGAFIYDPSAHHFNSGFQILTLVSGAEVGLLLYWYYGIIGFVSAALAVLIARHWLWRRASLALAVGLPAAYVLGIAAGLMTTVLSGHVPNIAM